MLGPEFTIRREKKKTMYTLPQEVHEGCADVKTSQLQVREKLLPSVLSLIDSFREDPEDHTLREVCCTASPSPQRWQASI